MNQENNIQTPVQIASVDENNQIHWNIEIFRQILSQSQNRLIKIVICIGGYQKGKTTLIKAITGNGLHQVGNGEDEQTDGAYLDGKYDKAQLAQRFNIQCDPNDPDMDIYFVDIEGYGSFNRGNADQLNEFYAKLCAPLIAISSCIFFIADRNESIQSINQVFTALHLGYFTLIPNNDNTEFPIQMITLIRNIEAYNGIMYNEPCEPNYIQISQQLTQNWQVRRFQNINFSMSTKPLPSYNNLESFNNGIKFVVSDLFNLLQNPNDRIDTKDPNIIIDFFQKMCNSENPLDHEFLQNASLDFFGELMRILVRSYYNRSINQLNEIIDEYEQNQENHHIFERIENDEQVVFDTLYSNAIHKFAQILENELNRRYFQYKEVNREIFKIIVHDIRTLVTNRMEALMERIGRIQRKQKYWRFGAAAVAVIGAIGIGCYIGPTLISLLAEAGAAVGVEVAEAGAGAAAVGAGVAEAAAVGAGVAEAGTAAAAVGAGVAEAGTVAAAVGAGVAEAGTVAAAVGAGVAEAGAAGAAGAAAVGVGVAEAGVGAAVAEGGVAAGVIECGAAVNGIVEGGAVAIGPVQCKLAFEKVLFVPIILKSFNHNDNNI